MKDKRNYSDTFTIEDSSEFSNNKEEGIDIEHSQSLY